MSLLTLLTDFGNQDAYGAVMKGVIAQIAPHACIIDLTHEIPPQDIAAARFCLLTAYPYFPARTIHVGVVDPGVGTARRGIAVAFAEGFFVGPDNGLVSGVLSQSPALEAVELDQPRYWRSPHPSTTFHGRDIFAPVAAHMALGVPLRKIGSSIAPETLVQLPLPSYQTTETGGIGYIQACDRFGNLITNLPGTLITQGTWHLEVSQHHITGVHTYGDRPLGELVALIGSHGWIEIARNQGNAQNYLQLEPGAPITLVSGSPPSV